MIVERIEKEVIYEFLEEDEFKKYETVMKHLEEIGVLKIGGIGSKGVNTWGISFSFLEIGNEYCKGM